MPGLARVWTVASEAYYDWSGEAAGVQLRVNFTLKLLLLLLLLLFFFFSSLTAVPSENQCMSSGAYEWPVLVALKHAVGLSQHWFSKFLLQECF